MPYLPSDQQGGLGRNREFPLDKNLNNHLSRDKREEQLKNTFESANWHESDDVIAPPATKAKARAAMQTACSATPPPTLSVSLPTGLTLHKLGQTGDYYVVQGPGTFANKDAIKGAGGTWKKQQKLWFLTGDPSIIAEGTTRSANAQNNLGDSDENQETGKTKDVQGETGGNDVGAAAGAAGAGRGNAPGTSGDRRAAGSGSAEINKEYKPLPGTVKREAKPVGCVDVK